jgi:hypothetical protein
MVLMVGQLLPVYSCTLMGGGLTTVTKFLNLNVKLPLFNG